MKLVDKVVSWWQARMPLSTAFVLGGTILLAAYLGLDGLDKWSAKKQPESAAEQIRKQVEKEKTGLDGAVVAQLKVVVIELGHCQYWAGKDTSLVHLGNCTNHGTFVKTLPVSEESYWYGFCRDKAGYDKYQAEIREAYKKHKEGVKASP